MTETTLTPPQKETRKEIFAYDESKFIKTLSKIKEDLFPYIGIKVWAPINTNGTMVNVLKSKLSGDAFDELCKHAAYVTYEGSYHDLCRIGVIN